MCEAAGISWGSAQHHLYLLQQAGLVEALRLGKNLSLFPAGRPARARWSAALLRDPRTRSIAEFVTRRPGVQQSELCRRLRITRKVFRFHLDRLVAAGLIEEHAEPKRRTYRATGELRLPSGPLPTPPLPWRVSPPATV